MGKLTVADVAAAVAKIERVRGDDEAAHGREDDLHQRVLRHIADETCDDPRGCAAEALKTLKIKFARWCA